MLDKLSLGLRLGTRLLWRPSQRLKHRLTAWLLKQLTPVLFSELLAQFSRVSKPSPAARSTPRRAKLTPRAKWWLAWIAQRVFRRMIAS